MATGAAAAFVGVTVAIFLFFLIFLWLMILISRDKRKIIVRRHRHNDQNPPPDSPRDDSSSSDDSTPVPIACGVVLPPRPDFSTLPSGSVTIQSIGATPAPITIFRGGFVDVIASSSTGNDIPLRVPPGERNIPGTTIRVSNSGRVGDIIFAPLSGVTLCDESDARVAPLTTGYFTVLTTNFYARLP